MSKSQKAGQKHWIKCLLDNYQDIVTSRKMKKTRAKTGKLTGKKMKDYRSNKYAFQFRITRNVLVSKRLDHQLIMQERLMQRCYSHLRISNNLKKLKENKKFRWLAQGHE